MPKGCPSVWEGRPNPGSEGWEGDSFPKEAVEGIFERHFRVTWVRGRGSWKASFRNLRLSQATKQLPGSFSYPGHLIQPSPLS